MAAKAYADVQAAHQALKESMAESDAVEERQLDRSASPEPKTAVGPDTLRSLNEQLLKVPEGFNVHRKLKPPSSSAARRRSARMGARLGARRVAGLGVAAPAGRADPPDRPGLRARHVQPAPPGSTTRRPASRGRRSSTWPARRRRSAAQLAAVGDRGARLRVRLQRAGTRGARAVGGPVRRLRQQRAGRHRPVHRLGAGQVGPDHAPDAAPAARLRPAGPEHSSGRLERFLQLGAEGNIRVANCTTPGQYFHLLAARRWSPSAARW